MQKNEREEDEGEEGDEELYVEIISCSLTSVVMWRAERCIER